MISFPIISIDDKASYRWACKSFEMKNPPCSTAGVLLRLNFCENVHIQWINWIGSVFLKKIIGVVIQCAPIDLCMQFCFVIASTSSFIFFPAILNRSVIFFNPFSFVSIADCWSPNSENTGKFMTDHIAIEYDRIMDLFRFFDFTVAETVLKFNEFMLWKWLEICIWY